MMVQLKKVMKLYGFLELMKDIELVIIVERQVVQGRQLCDLMEYRH